MIKATPTALRSPPAMAASHLKRGLRTPPPPPSPPIRSKKAASTSAARRSLVAAFSEESSPPEQKWELLGVNRSEISLPLTLPTGQTFRWRKSGPDQFTGVIGNRIISLKHLAGDPLDQIAFLHHGAPASAFSAAAVRDYLNLDIEVSLPALWEKFAAADQRFSDLSQNLAGGVRVLRQDPVECLFQFLCSSNNNIARIERMVNVLSSYGDYLGTVNGVDFHQFPSIDRLAEVSEEQLREAGFGYRAKFIVNTAKAVKGKPGGGVEWLNSLRRLDLAECIEALCTLPGVGPKVAACIALFSLDHHNAIPVDTHVWKIAVRDMIPELGGVPISPKHFKRVSEAFQSRYGRYAGWAQAALFVGELSSQKKRPVDSRRKRKSSSGDSMMVLDSLESGKIAHNEGMVHYFRVN